MPRTSVTKEEVVEALKRDSHFSSPRVSTDIEYFAERLVKAIEGKDEPVTPKGILTVAATVVEYLLNDNRYERGFEDQELYRDGLRHKLMRLRKQIDNPPEHFYDLTICKPATIIWSLDMSGDLTWAELLATDPGCLLPDLGQRGY